MADPTSFEELDQAIGNVLDAETANFFELAEILGLDPKQDFAGANLSETDFFQGDLAGANFTGTDLRGANFAYANLQGANLTNADLGILPSSYLARTKELHRLITNTLDRDSAIDLALVRDLAIDLDRDIARNRNFAIGLTRDLDLIRDRDSARDLAFAITRALDIIHPLAGALILAITRDSARDRTLTLANTLALPLPRDHALDLIRTIGGGANFYKANLTGVVIDGANVEGAVMISCAGLSSSQIADLERRGAIFDNSPGDRSEVRVPVPVPR